VNVSEVSNVHHVHGAERLVNILCQLSCTPLNSPDMTANDNENAESRDQTNQRSGLWPIGCRKTTTLAYNREDGDNLILII